MCDEIVVNWECVNVRYADDEVITIIEKGLQKIMEKVSNTIEKYGMKLNTKKTKVVVVCKNINQDIATRIKKNKNV